MRLNAARPNRGRAARSHRAETTQTGGGLSESENGVWLERIPNRISLRDNGQEDSACMYT